MTTSLGCMRWVTFLPEVGDQMLKPRNAIVELMREATTFDEQVSAARAAAYQASVDLESRIRSLWTDAEVEAAKAKAKTTHTQ